MLIHASLVVSTLRIYLAELRLLEFLHFPTLDVGPWPLLSPTAHCSPFPQFHFSTSFKIIDLQSDWLCAGGLHYIYHLHYIAVGHLAGRSDKNCLALASIKQLLQPAS